MDFGRGPIALRNIKAERAPRYDHDCYRRWNSENRWVYYMKHGLYTNLNNSSNEHECGIETETETEEKRVVVCIWRWRYHIFARHKGFQYMYVRWCTWCMKHGKQPNGFWMRLPISPPIRLTFHSQPIGDRTVR